MTTPLEIIDSAVKIGLGALVSGIATYLVTRTNHRHELRKADREERRTLIRNISRVLEDAMTLVNQGTYAFQQDEGVDDAGSGLLVGAINKLGEAKSLAVLLGNHELSKAITELRAGIVELAHYVGPGSKGRDPATVNRMIGKMNMPWPTIHAELESSYAKVGSDA